MDKLFWLLPRRLSSLRKLVWLRLSGAAAEIWRTITAAIATFTAVASPLRQLSVAVEPVQNLNGYDNPWPAGGGDNLLPPQNISGPMSSVIVTSNGDIVTLNGTASAYGHAMSSNTFVLDAGTYFLKIFVVSGSVTSGYVQYQLRSVDGLAMYVSTTTGLEFTLNERTELKPRVAYSNGSVISNYIIQAMIVRGSTAPTAYSPYSNICPITGWNSVTVNRTGMNVWDEEWEQGTIDTSTGGETPETNRIRPKNFIPVKPSIRYAHTERLRLFEYDANKQYIGYKDFGGTVGGFATFITSANCYYLRFTTTLQYGGEYHDNISFNYPYSTTDHEYHAYSGNTYTIQLGETVYGGTLDVVNGKMKVDRAMVDMGDLSWSRNTGASSQIARYYVVGLANVVKKTSNAEVANALCEIYKIASANDGYVGREINCVTIDSSGYISCYPSEEYADAPTFKTAMSGVQFVYELATPFELTLTPEQISTLQGTNNVWSDAGNVTVEYRAQ